MQTIESYSLLAGGAEITSYNLQYNLGAGTSFVDLIGFTTEQLG